MKTFLSTAIAAMAFGLAAIASGGPASAQGATVASQPDMSIAGGPSLVRPEFTRPGGLPGASRGYAGNSQYMIAPVQPSDQPSPTKRKPRR